MYVRRYLPIYLDRYLSNRVIYMHIYTRKSTGIDWKNISFLYPQLGYINNDQLQSLTQSYSDLLVPIGATYTYLLYS